MDRAGKTIDPRWIRCADCNQFSALARFDFPQVFPPLGILLGTCPRCGALWAMEKPYSGSTNPSESALITPESAPIASGSAPITPEPAETQLGPGPALAAPVVSTDPRQRKPPPLTLMAPGGLQGPVPPAPMASASPQYEPTSPNISFSHFDWSISPMTKPENGFFGPGPINHGLPSPRQVPRSSDYPWFPDLADFGNFFYFFYFFIFLLIID